jgi:hypothetical protein
MPVGDVCCWLWCHIWYRDRYLTVLLLDFGVEGDYLGPNTIMAAQGITENFWEMDLGTPHPFPQRFSIILGAWIAILGALFGFLPIYVLFVQWHHRIWT